MDEDPSEYARAMAENGRYAEAFDRSRLTAAPLTGLAIVACMDARIDIEDALGLRAGDAHIIRNAGGLVTDDVSRSLIVSQQLMGTDEIIVIEHSGCGLHGASEAAIRARTAELTGGSPDTVEVTFGAFADLEANLREQLDRLRANPFLRPVPIHGLIYDVVTGRLHEIA
jgi:carbonic anhydrase